MKKVVCLLMALTLLFALAACGGNGGTASTSPSPSSSAQPSPSTAESTAPGGTSETPPDASTPTDSAPASPSATGDAPAWNPDNIGEQSFVLAHGMAPTSFVGQQYHLFALAVEELSGGKMTVEEKIGGTLLQDTETLDAIMNGTIDFCHSMGSYVSGTVKDLSPLTIAGYYGGDDWLGFAETTRSLVSDIYADYNIKYLGALYQGTSCIATNGHAVKTPGDVAGLTMRASGEWVSKTVQAWGGAATTIGLADLADAFSKNTVEGVATGFNIIVPFGIYEVVDYITVTEITEGFAGLLMNSDRWASLNADEQALLTAAGLQFEQEAHALALELNEGYIQTIEDADVNEIYTLTPEEQQPFVDLAIGLYEEMAPGLGEKGLQLIDILKELNGVE